MIKQALPNNSFFNTLFCFVKNNIRFGSTSNTLNLGRWGYTNPELKADLTNEDHCGVCSDKRNTYIKKMHLNK